MNYQKPQIVSLSLSELENASMNAFAQTTGKQIGGGGCACQCQCQCQAQ